MGRVPAGRTLRAGVTVAPAPESGVLEKPHSLEDVLN